MVVIVFFTFIGIFLFSDLINAKSKMGLTIVAALVLGMIMGGGYDIPDYSMYDSMYTASIVNFNYSFDYKDSGQGGYSRNIGYTILNNIFGTLGLSYQEYKIFTSIILLLLLLLYIKKIVPKISFVLLLYVLYPFFMDIIQLRVFYTEVILLIAVYYLSKYDRNKLGVFVFCVLVMLSGMFHSMGWLWLLFIPFRLLLQSKKFKFISWLFIITGILLPVYASFISNSFLPIMYMMAESDVTAHYQIYTMRDTVRLGYLYVWGYDLALAGLLYKMKKIMIESSSTQLQKMFVTNTYNLFLFVICILPASAIATESFRWSRVLMIESYIALVIYTMYETNHVRRNLIAFCLLLVTILASYLNFYEGSSEFVLSSFVNNVFFDW